MVFQRMEQAKELRDKQKEFSIYKLICEVVLQLHGFLWEVFKNS